MRNFPNDNAVIAINTEVSPYGPLSPSDSLFLFYYILRTVRGRMFIIRVITSVFMVLATACSGFSVMSDYDRGYDFSRNRFYRWVGEAEKDSSDVLAANPLVRKRLRASVEKVLAERGFMPSAFPANAALVLDARVYVGQKSVIRYEPYLFDPYFHHRGRGFGDYHPIDPFAREPVLYRYDEVMFLIDMLDVRSRQVVWSGSATGPMKRYSTGESMQKEIDLAVSEIFSDFPVPKPVR